MRFSILLVLSLTWLSATGCGALEELDKANTKMGTGKGKKEEPAAATAGNSGAASSKSELLEQSKEWWGRATSLAPADTDSKIVSCRLREGTQFMAKDDCVIRGGVPSNVSG